MLLSFEIIDTCLKLTAANLTVKTSCSISTDSLAHFCTNLDNHHFKTYQTFLTMDESSPENLTLKKLNDSECSPGLGLI